MAKAHKKPHPVEAIQNNYVNIAPNKYHLYHIPLSLSSSCYEYISNGDKGDVDKHSKKIEVSESHLQRPKKKILMEVKMKK